MSCCSLSAASASVGSSTSLRRTCSTRRPRQPRRTRRFGEGQGGGGGMGRADEPNTRGFRGQRRAFCFLSGGVCGKRAGKRGLDREAAKAAREPGSRESEQVQRLGEYAAATVRSIPPSPVGAGGIRRVCERIGVFRSPANSFRASPGLHASPGGPQKPRTADGPSQPRDPPLSVRRLSALRTLRTQLSACSARK